MTSKRNENWAELNSLIALFEDALQVTTNARNIIIISSQQTVGLLTGWEIPEFPYEAPVCTCSITSSKREEEISKMVRNVEEAVVSAQKIREKSDPQHKLKAKQKDSLPSVSCAHPNAESKKDTQKYSIFSKMGSTAQSNMLPKGRSISKLVTQKIGENAVRRLPIKCSKPQTTYQKDFPVPSKLPNFRQHSASPRLCSRKEISTQDMCKLNEGSVSKQDFLQNAQRFPLSQKSKIDVSHSELKKSSSISVDQASQQSAINMCPVHGNGKLLKKQSSCVNLAEAIDVLGVPPEMVKYLRSYHSFVQKEDKPVRASKGKKAAEKFIEHLTEVNGWQWKDVEQEPLGSLFQESVSLFTQVFGMDELGSDIERRMEDLDKKCQKWFNLSESVSPNLYSREHLSKLSPLQDNLLINGIWNFKNTRQCKFFQYLRYSNPVHWRKYFKNVQDIQRLDLQLQVFDELDGIVALFEKLSPDDPSFILFFKAVCTICDIGKLSLPVIFKS